MNGVTASDRGHRLRFIHARRRRLAEVHNRIRNSKVLVQIGCLQALELGKPVESGLLYYDPVITPVRFRVKEVEE